MTLVQNLRVAGGRYTKPNIYDDAADRINELEAALRQYWEAKTPAAMGAADAVAAKLLTGSETTLPLSERVEQKIIDECFGAETACEHDLQKSNCTVEVQQLAKVQRGECTVCHEVWINPPYGMLAFQSKTKGDAT